MEKATQQFKEDLESYKTNELAKILNYKARDEKRHKQDMKRYDIDIEEIQALEHIPDQGEFIRRIN